jgi:cytochrome c
MRDRKDAREANNENSIRRCTRGFVDRSTIVSFADNSNGKNLYSQRCAVCHGADIKGTGPLAHKSNPPTPESDNPRLQETTE